MTLPLQLQKDLKSENKNYTYKELCYLVAWGCVPRDIREKMDPDQYIAAYPDVWNMKLVEAHHLISRTPFSELDF
jgi:hypothetical protein